MKVTVEPTSTVVNITINGVEVPLRIYVGSTDSGTPVELFTFSIVPAATHADRFASEIPPFMKRTREVAKIGNLP